MLNPTAINAGIAALGKAAPTSGLPPALAGLPAGTRISGAVIGREGPGQLQLRTTAGMVVISTTLKLARGTVVNLRVRQGASPRLTIDSVAPEPGIAGAPQAGLGSSLIADLNEALALLGKAGPGVVPGLALPGDRLASAVLGYLAALKRGDFTGWFGATAIDVLESRGGSTLLSRLAAHFSAQSALTEPAPSGEWQALMVPLQLGETVRQLRFFLRRGGDGKRDGDGNADNRFVVEVETSRLGGLQLDGLIKAARFDLVLRSHRPLPDEARRDISEIFADGLAITGQTGKIAFQAMASFPVVVADPLPGRANQGILV